MSKVSIGDEEYEAADLLAFQQFNLWLYELVLGSVDGTDDKVVEDLKSRIAKCYANIDWVSGSYKGSENESIL
ncbi:hypothetical protein N9104_03345 [Pseudomonadales bacterium]|nr:hypothetical protein [Pseudomonadales bacterium]